MKQINCEQRSPEWIIARMGIPTASEFDRIVSPTGKVSRQQHDYMLRLLFEWMTGVPIDDPATKWMERGIELEDQAVGAYELARDVETDRVGLLLTDDGMIGASPDRLVGADGLVEIKCLGPAGHMGMMISESAARDYWPQLQGQLWVSEREWVDLVAYHPQAPLAIRRVTRDETWLKIFEPTVHAFVSEMLELRLMLEREFGPFTRPDLTREPTGDLGPFGVSDEDVDAIIAARGAKRNGAK